MPSWFKSALRNGLLALSTLASLAIGLTCFIFLIFTLLFCDSCKGLGDWIKVALPVWAVGAVAISTTLAGYALYQRRRWAIGTISLIILPSAIALSASDPALRQNVPALNFVDFPVQIFRSARRDREDQKAGDALMTQAAASLSANANISRLPEGWRLSDSKALEIGGLSFGVCNAAAASKYYERMTARATCKRTDEDWVLTVQPAPANR